MFEAIKSEVNSSASLEENVNGYRTPEKLNTVQRGESSHVRQASPGQMEAFLEKNVGGFSEQPCVPSRPIRNGNKHFTCSRCDKHFTRNFTLQRHMKKHTQAKGHQCNFCTRAFYRKDVLQRHEVVCQRNLINKMPAEQVNLEQSTLHQRYCGKVLTGEEDTNRVHFNTRKMFTCESCNKNFSRKFALDSHKKIHERLPLQIFFENLLSERHETNA